jgi:hypothetical protein
MASIQSFMLTLPTPVSKVTINRNQPSDFDTGESPVSPSWQAVTFKRFRESHLQA